jgi:hypothetical protein
MVVVEGSEWQEGEFSISAAAVARRRVFSEAW